MIDSSSQSFVSDATHVFGSIFATTPVAHSYEEVEDDTLEEVGRLAKNLSDELFLEVRIDFDQSLVDTFVRGAGL